MRDEDCRTNGIRRGRVAVLASLAATVALALPGGASAAGATHCADLRIPAQLGDATPVTIVGVLCRPAGRPPATVQLLLHGGTYNHSYWDFQATGPNGDPHYYSYVRSAVAAGYATLAVDRLGYGASTRPNSAEVTEDNTSLVLHQLIVGLRAGTVDAGVHYARVIEVSHSFGAAAAIREVTDHPGDADAVALTGDAHLEAPDAQTNAISQLYPASADPLFGGLGLDGGYLTSLPGVRGSLFYYAPGADPAVIARDEATKDTLTVTEAVTAPAAQTLLTEQIHIPVIVMDGDHDNFFCTPGGTDCSSSASIVHDEAPYFAGDACMVASSIPNTGHDLTMHRSAPYSAAVLALWASIVVPADGRAGGCTALSLVRHLSPILPFA